MAPAASTTAMPRAMYELRVDLSSLVIRLVIRSPAMTFEFNQKPGVVVTLFLNAPRQRRQENCSRIADPDFVESDPGLDQRCLSYGVGGNAFGGAPVQDCFRGNKRERDPDEQKSDEMLASECLMINKKT